ncbi:hypothetical protein [Halalkalibacter akibai]|nr:hypothetical protein [Halalkalibacter akibai]
MENKPNHYDGSLQKVESSVGETAIEPFKLTDEMRINISGNPYNDVNND